MTPMLPARIGSFAMVIALLVLPTGYADAAPAGGLAARAVAHAKSMPAGRERDTVLRAISRNLRYADRDHAIEAAAAMSEDYELRTFSPGPDEVTRQLLAQQNAQSREERACEQFFERLKPGEATAADDQRIRDCFSMDGPIGLAPPPIPPFPLILLAADALPPGPTKAQLLYMATWDGVPDRPVGGASDAVRRLRALIPLLDGSTRREAAGWLDTTSVDLIEGRPDDAIARVMQNFASKPSATDSLSDDPVTQAQGLIADFLIAHDIERAVRVTDLLSPSNDCTMVDEGLTGVMAWVLPTQDSALVAAYMARLQTSGALERLCPRGLSGEIAADIWLKAGNNAKALENAAQSGKSMVLIKTRLAIIEHRLEAGDVSGARSVLQAASAAPVAVHVGNPFDRAAAARQYVRLIHLLTKVGDVEEAERLASSYPGPGWRGFAYSVIVATANRERAGPDWGGPSLDLDQVSADH